MFGKKKNEGGWGAYDGKSRKSSSWGDEIRSGWDTAGADVSLSFTPGADTGGRNGENVAKTAGSDLGWGGKSVRAKSGWSDTHDAHRAGDKKDAVDSSLSWGGKSVGAKSGWSDTHDAHRAGDKKDAVDSSLSWGGKSVGAKSGWSDTNEGEQKGALVTSGGSSNTLAGTYDRRPYDKACSKYARKKKLMIGGIVALAVVGFVLSLPNFLVISLVLVLSVMAFINCAGDITVVESYRDVFLKPYLKNKFNAEYKEGFLYNPSSAVSYYDDINEIEGCKMFNLLSFKDRIHVYCVISGSASVVSNGNVHSMRIKIYNYVRIIETGTERRYVSGVLIRLPLRGYIVNPVRIIKCENMRVANRKCYMYEDLMIDAKLKLFNCEASEDSDVDAYDDFDSIEIDGFDDIIGSRVQSEQFFKRVLYAYNKIKATPEIYFCDNYAYVYMDLDFSIYSGAGEKGKEVERLEEDTAKFWPFCEAIMKDTDVFGGTWADWAEESHIGSVEA
ncbi:MAG: hypothetical protein IJ165_12650 [Proteobacteria bacterium]|nr:hypothetical protein [Pseudomonadota bacterium]